MVTAGLGAFIGDNREEIVVRCRTRAGKIANWPSTDEEIERGIPMFLDQLTEELRHRSSQTGAIRKTAVQHGRDLCSQGFSVSQVVHDYGNVCQSVTDLAVELAVPISTDDFRTLNRCLDDAIAGAVSEYVAHRPISSNAYAHELLTLANAAITAFEAMQTAGVAVTATTGAVVRGSLLSLRARLEGNIARVG